MAFTVIMKAPNQLYQTFYAPLVSAIPDLERRDWIVVRLETKQ